jgi:hypothetical protein
MPPHFAFSPLSSDFHLIHFRRRRRRHESDAKIFFIFSYYSDISSMPSFSPLSAARAAFTLHKRYARLIFSSECRYFSPL